MFSSDTLDVHFLAHDRPAICHHRHDIPSPNVLEFAHHLGEKVESGNSQNGKFYAGVGIAVFGRRGEGSSLRELPLLEGFGKEGLR